ncbi:STAS domain-containing protein [Chitiniphilus purpureus]|uniref:STAS domain-containing protein n=1 Tax=Chitiniphilus purpureus TaxID=2981137 RepID=A0ABY6DRJ0_9NEIS|nr:STAS domain-containing protein [Chitiniphilus sp. CD1]UXY16328.1 STAS domain-containing protein [Chitiniphilus sp. CD1]
MPLFATDESGTYRLTGELTIFYAAMLKDELVALLGTAKAPLSLDLSGVEDIDTSGVQLLLMFKREAARRGASVSYSGHSPAVLAVLELLDLAGTLGDPVLIPNAVR